MYLLQIQKLIYLATTAGGSLAVNPTQGTGYTLDSIGFQITRYDMSSTYFDGFASALQSGAVSNDFILTILQF
jgi:hypothetical protein